MKSSDKNKLIPKNKPDQMRVLYHFVEIDLEEVQRRLDEAFDILFREVIRNRGKPD